jgi:hypothetical protein
MLLARFEWGMRVWVCACIQRRNDAPVYGTLVAISFNYWNRNTVWRITFLRQIKIKTSRGVLVVLGSSISRILSPFSYDYNYLPPVALSGILQGR